jgi:hypothetical protein
LALVLKVFRNRFCCHGQSVADLSRPSCSLLATCWRFTGPLFQISISNTSGWNRSDTA